jgi:hypothetical protein
MNAPKINIKSIAGRINKNLSPKRIKKVDDLGLFRIGYELYEGGPTIQFAVRTGQTGIAQIDIDRVIKGGGLL